ncbi:helicase DnaB [Rhizobium sp. rho-13.1]|uniref:DnaB-like helicase C-terminal domain-containing protein n=1 Tax=Rhizobium sp. rho-13.1 TaxID=2506431 RepID=UPI00115E3ABF|nr:DnaB-like helicase C-terminal domain-containing protein [Rhizobium sp. rho-13.1]TQX91291.1 helicase DnaB [Rhizobium sp. rho-13.1]
MNMAPRDFMDRVTEDDLIEAEQDVLAALMVENELLSETGLEDIDFLEGLHQTIYASIEKLSTSNQAASAVTLKPFVPKELIRSTITPAQYLMMLQRRGADPDNRRKFEAALQIIKGKSLARQIGNEAQYMASMASEGHSLLTLGDELEQLENRVKEMKARFSETTAITSPGNSYLAMFQASAKRDGVVGVPIAFPELAKVLSEPVFEAGNLYGLLSSSGEGKTSFTVHLIYHAITHGHPVLFLSYDQSAAQCVRQMISQVHSIDLNQQRDPMGKMTDMERDTCVQFANWINQQPFQVVRCQREGIDRLVAYTRRFVKKFANGKTPFVVLDHIGKVKPKDAKLSADRISGDVTVEAKACADETSSAWLILNQRNGAGDKRDNPRPIAADLYGGTGARADYDAVATIYSPEKYKAEREKIASNPSDWAKINRVFGSDIEGHREIAVIKSRFGDPNITETMDFIGRYTRFASKPKPVHTQERML